MSFVVDCSVALKWVVSEAGSDAANSLLGDELFAPDFIYVECANALWKLAQRREATAEQSAFKLRAIRLVKVRIAPAIDVLSRALDMSGTLQHPVYDCLYLAVAETFSTRVVTADNRLLNRVANTPFAALAISLQDAAAN